MGLTVSLSREEIALRILCALIVRSGSDIATRDGIRAAFLAAQAFEDMANEFGGRPSRTIGRRAAPDENWDD